ncbi:hypothetical protein [Acaryochloris marina]|uniref:Uncharacterized protein n=1 Tax=Acaryochloris marina (strain MBIC 11017) TaxID=329726 RepID=A8ZK84_ACAM1|nr:hypothetical protein [Acaryochloris marina]ABW31584.1 hypothetical protein AM1_A0075 [Acaryochloris marina MBIC11017]KAI9129152.1 hypothetical protein ON05_036235 [Acaryochloris sp. CCMEE 5410]
MNNFLSGIALVFSTLALLMSGAVLYLDLTTRGVLYPQANLSEDPTHDKDKNPSPLGGISSEPTAVPDSNTVIEAPQSVSESKADEFIQPAFNSKATVELISVKRIKHPEKGTRNIVNVRLRFRRLAENATKNETFDLSDTQARHSETNEVYKQIINSTGLITLQTLPLNASAEGYFWLEIPERTTTIDIVIPKTEMFRNVPITG